MDAHLPDRLPGVAVKPRLSGRGYKATICGPAKSWLDAACGELLRQVAYKARWNSKHFVQVNRFFPATKLCSACGYKNDDLSLSEREWICLGCGTHHLRDLNAAKNVRVEGLRIVAEGHPETENACGLRVRLAEASVAG